MQVELLHFIPRAESHPPRVVGYVHVSVPSIGMNLYDVKLMRRRGEVFAHLPERPLHEGDKLVFDEHKRVRFRRTMRFHNNDDFIELSKAIVEALRAEHPEALAEFLPSGPITAATHDGDHS